MAGKGPPRTPTALLKARGSTLAAAREAVELTLPAGCPEVPENIGAEGARVWREVCNTLAPVGALSRSDWIALTVLCRTYQQWHDLDAIAALDAAKGDVTKAVKHCRTLAAEVRQLWAQFGLSPASRAGLAIPAGRPKPSGPADVLTRVLGGS